MTPLPCRSIKGILFDKDGTLFDFHRTWLPLALEAADIASGGDKKLGQSLLEKGGLVVETSRFLPDSVIAAGNTLELAHLWTQCGACHSSETLQHILDELFTRLGPEKALPVTDLIDCFGRLKARGLYLGLATNDSEASARATSDSFGLSPLLSFMAGYDSGFGPKPAPGMAHAFCRTVGLEAPRIAVVGDSSHDMAMGHSAGAGLKVGVLSGAGTRESLAASADIIISDISQLEGLLFNRGEEPT